MTSISTEDVFNNIGNTNNITQVSISSLDKISFLSTLKLSKLRVCYNVIELRQQECREIHRNFPDLRIATFNVVKMTEAEASKRKKKIDREGQEYDTTIIEDITSCFKEILTSSLVTKRMRNDTELSYTFVFGAMTMELSISNESVLKIKGNIVDYAMYNPLLALFRVLGSNNIDSIVIDTTRNSNTSIVGQLVVFGSNIVPITISSKKVEHSEKKSDKNKRSSKDDDSDLSHKTHYIKKTSSDKDRSHNKLQNKEAHPIKDYVPDKVSSYNKEKTNKPSYKEKKEKAPYNKEKVPYNKDKSERPSVPRKEYRRKGEFVDLNVEVVDFD